MNPEARPPPRIPDYELLRLIGQGSYGDVWLARGVTGLYRAVKIVWRDRFSEVHPYEREFSGLREFATVSLLEPRQLALLHVGRNDREGFFYYVMELADDVAHGGEIDPAHYVPHTLKEVHRQLGRRPADEVLRLGVELAHGLADLHARGLVHRDIKPSNVIFVSGAPKLADIGLVSVATSARTFVGTEGFVPPEGSGTPAADVFSLGKLLYEMLTGLDRHAYPRLPPNLHQFPDRKQFLELNEILIRACEPLPAQRYRDAGALLADLQLLQNGRSMRRLRLAERWSSRVLRLGLVAAGVVLVAGVGGWAERTRADKNREDRSSVRSFGLNSPAARPHGAQDDTRGDNVANSGTDSMSSASHAGAGDFSGAPPRLAPSASETRMCLSPDGTLFAIQDEEESVTLWDVTKLEPTRRVRGVRHLAGFSLDGQWLVGADSRFAFARWAAATGLPDANPAMGENRPISTLAETDRGLCFTVGKDGLPHALRIWDFARHAETWRWSLPHETSTRDWQFHRAAVSPDQRLCAIALIEPATRQKRCRLFVTEIGGQHQLLEQSFEHSVNTLSFSRDGTLLAVSVGPVAELHVLDLAAGRRR